MTRPAWTRGKAVVDGQVKYLSPSQIVTADPDSYGGCLRRWWFAKVAGKKEPTSKAQAAGTEGHAQIESYLRTGKLDLGPHALAGKRFIPEPGPDLLIEHAIDDGTLFAAGIPVVGFIDLVSARRAIMTEDLYTTDPEGVVEVIDWKFTGRIENAKSAMEVARAIPMVAYGEWAARKFGVEHVRLSHVYFSTKKRESTKSSALVSRSDLSMRWNKAEAIARTIIDAASESDCSKVDANLDSCGAYGGCPHRAYCPGGQSKTLTDIFGVTGAATLLGTKEPNMSLLNLPGLKNMAAPGSKDEQVAAAKAELLAPPPEVVAAVETIANAGLGQPHLGGEAVKLWAQVKGLDLQGDGLAGHGQLAAATLSTKDELLQAAKEIAALPAQESAPEAATAAEAPPALLPPDAPESKPETASAAPEPTPEPKPEEAESLLDSPAEKGIATTPGAFEIGSADLKMSKKCREYVDGLEAYARSLESKPTWTAEVTQVAAPPQPQGNALTIYVDALPMGEGETVDLWPWVNDLASKIAEQSGAKDIRWAPDKNSPLAFGGWRGVLAAACREMPLEPGSYILDTRGSEIAEVAAEALRERATVYVRGMGR